MPEDLSLPPVFDETGDMKSVTGEDFYYNHVLQLGLIAAEDIKGGSLAANEIISLESDIRDKLIESPYVDPPVTVTILDSDDETLKAEVGISNFSEFTIDLDTPDDI